MNMKKRHLYIGSFVIVLLLTLLFANMSGDNPKPRMVNHDITDKKENQNRKTAEISEKFKNWKRWDNETRLHEVSVLQGKPLPDDVVALMYEQIRNNDLGDQLRNNMSECLFANVKKEMKLTQVYYRMMNDPEEEKNWQLYAMQFFARTAQFADKETKGLIQVELEKLSFNDDRNYACSAMNMLAFVSATNDWLSVSEMYLPKLHKVTINSNVGMEKRIVAQEVLKRFKYMPAVSAYRINAVSSDPRLRISALGALGIMGTKKDLSIIRKSIGNKDKRVDYAAQLAIKSLSKRKVNFSERSKVASHATEITSRKLIVKKDDPTMLQKFKKAVNSKNANKHKKIPFNN